MAEEEFFDYLRNGVKLTVEAVVPRGEKEGFFIVNRVDSVYGPLIVKEIRLANRVLRTDTRAGSFSLDKLTKTPREDVSERDEEEISLDY
jgi:tryptophan 2,3-dioxygenase